MEGTADEAPAAPDRRRERGTDGPSADRSLNALIMLAIPGAIDAGATDPLFWGSLAVSLAIAGVLAFPANRWLIARGRGHAVVHSHHAH
jgi:hypothetical protein